MIVLVVAVLADLLAIAPLFRMLHHQKAYELPKIAFIRPVFSWLAVRIKRSWLFLSQMVGNTRKWIKSFHGSSGLKKITVSNGAVDNPVLPVSDPNERSESGSFDLSNLTEPASFGGDQAESLAPDRYQIRLNNPEQLVETTKGSQIKITVSLSPGQIVNIAVDSNTRNGHA